MTDDELDRLLVEAGTIEPTPPFVVRVRARLAEEASPTPSWTWPWLATSTAAVTIAVVLGKLWNPAEAPRAIVAPLTVPDAGITRSAAQEPARRDAALVAHGLPKSDPTARARSTAPSERRDAMAALADPGMPVFAAADRAAFALLIDYARAGALPPMLEWPDGIQVEGAEIAPLDVSSLEVLSLVTTDVTEGDPR